MKYLQLAAIHGTGDVEAKDTSMLLRKMGLRTKGLDATAADKSLEEERKTYTRDGEKEHGFTSSVVPTMEEKIVAEMSLPNAHHGNGKAQPKENGHTTLQQSPEAQIDGELFGAPANSDPDRDDHVPGTKREDSQASEIEEKAVDARGVLRKHLGSKLTSKQYTMPTPTPHVDPHGFEDPICDSFWKKTWLAAAVHNVSHHHSFSLAVS